MNMMNAIVLRRPGDVANMVWEQVSIPMPLSRKSVLIKVKAAGVNRPDLLQRQGKYAPPDDASPLLGLEVAGVIADPNGSSRWKQGDRVCALTHGGGYAEYVWVHEEHCLPLPEGWNFIEAASIPETFFTVWFNVFMHGNLGRDKPEVLLVHGGASGIGVAAIQMAKAMGNRVVVTVRREEQLEKCRSLGADEALLLDDQWEDKVQALCGGVDVVLDFLGTDTFKGNVHVLNAHGRIVWLAYLTGAKVELAIPKLMAKQLLLTGSFLRSQSEKVKAGIASELTARVWPMIAEGRIKPIVQAVFPIQEVGKAHQLLENGGVFGKIVLAVDGRDVKGEGGRSCC